MESDSFDNVDVTDLLTLNDSLDDNKKLAEINEFLLN